MDSARLHPLHGRLSQPLVRLTQPCLLAAFLRSHKELQTHCLLHPSRPPRPPNWLPSMPQEGHQLVSKVAHSSVVAVSRGQLPSLILQGGESSQCSTSHWDMVAALPLVSVCHVFLVLSKEISRHESRACFALFCAGSIWKPSVLPNTHSTTGAALSFGNWFSQEVASYCDPEKKWRLPTQNKEHPNCGVEPTCIYRYQLVNGKII